MKTSICADFIVTKLHYFVLVRQLSKYLSYRFSLQHSYSVSYPNLTRKKTPYPMPIDSSKLKEYCLLLNLFNFYHKHLLLKNKQESYLNWFLL
jgi:hypothetical protein